MRRLALVIALALLAVPGSAAASILPGAVPDGVPRHHSAPLAHVANLPWGGGSVLHWNRTHLIFWAPAGSGLGFDPGYVSLFSTFMADVAHDSHLPSNVYGLTGQYTDNGGSAVYDSTYAGPFIDTDPLPSRDLACQEPSPPPLGEGPPGWNQCVTDNQIQDELSAVVAAHHLPVTLGDIYLLITPNGLGDCDTGSIPASCALGGADNNGYCAYHSVVGGSGLLYAVIPYNAVPGHCQSDSPRPNGSTADPGISSLSHEHNETITDPLGSGWIDGSGNEDGDLCIDTSSHPPRVLGATAAGRFDQVINGGRFWVQGEWSNQDGGCETADEPATVSFTVPGALTSGRRLALAARGADRDGRVVAMRWYFSDGVTVGGFRIHHTFRKPGRYVILVRGTDSSGNWGFAERMVRVRKPAARDRRH